MMFILLRSAAYANQRPRVHRRDAHTRVENLSSLFGYYKRVAIEFRNLRKVIDHCTDAKQRIFQNRHIKSLATAKAVEQWISLERANHFRRFESRNWRQPNGYVAKEFDLSTARATRNDRSELRVMHDA